MTCAKNLITLQVPSDTPAVRIDKWLSLNLKGYSRESIQQLLSDGLITIQGQIVKKKDPVIPLSVITLRPQPKPPIDLTPQPVAFKTLYEDPAIVVIDKPPGLVVHPGAGHAEKTLVHGLLHHFKDLEVETDDSRPGIVHRLDKDTSGVMVVAKTREAHFKLAAQFAARSVKKSYLAITTGKPLALSCDLPIRRDKKNRQAMSCDLEGKPACTHFKILAASDPYYLVQAHPITGRTHQIRVHLKQLKAPIFADQVYGGMKKVEQNSRQMLHAYSLFFYHPITQAPMTFKADPPEDFLEMLKRLIEPFDKQFFID